MQVAALLHAMKGRSGIVGRVEISVLIASGHIVEEVASSSCDQSQANCVPKIAQINLHSSVMDRKFYISLKRDCCSCIFFFYFILTILAFTILLYFL